MHLKQCFNNHCASACGIILLCCGVIKLIIYWWSHRVYGYLTSGQHQLFYDCCIYGTMKYYCEWLQWQRDVSWSLLLMTLWFSSWIHWAHCEHHVQFFIPLVYSTFFFSWTWKQGTAPSEELQSVFWILVPDGLAACCRISWNAGFFLVLNLCDKEKPERGCKAFNSSNVLHRGIPEEGSSGETGKRRRHLGAAGRARSFMLS